MLSIKVVDAVPVEDRCVLVFFENGKTKKFDTKPLMKKYVEFQALQDDDLFFSVQVEPGGYGISWNPDLDCSEGELYEDGKEIDISIMDFASFAKHGLLSTRDVADILHCSKQNIDDLVKRNKLHPIKFNDRYSLFFRTEVQQRVWDSKSTSYQLKDSYLLAAEKRY